LLRRREEDVIYRKSRKKFEAELKKFKFAPNFY